MSAGVLLLAGWSLAKAVSASTEVVTCRRETFSIDEALLRLDDHPTLAAVWDAVMSIDRAPEDFVLPPESAMATSATGSLAKYIAFARPGVSLSSLEAIYELNLVQRPLSGRARDEALECIRLYSHRRQAVEMSRAAAVARAVERLRAEHRLRPAQYRQEDPVVADFLAQQKRLKGAAADYTVHFRRSLYRDGSSFADWHVEEGDLCIITYNDAPLTRVADSLIRYLEQVFVCELATIFARAGHINPAEHGMLVRRWGA
jgi:hypothetical protein